MLLKILKKAVKLSLIALLILLILYPSKIKNLIDCDVSDGSISVAGNEISVNSSALLDAYTEVEKQASSLIPSEVSKLLESVSEWLSEFFGS